MPSNEIDREQTKSDEASTSNSSDSKRQQESPQSVSVLDYLYHDVPRVASYLAQFGNYGVPQQSKTGQIAKRGSVTKTGVAAGVDVPLVAKGGTTHETTTTNDQQRNEETTWDPLWANATSLL